MRINYFSATFLFNIFENHTDILELFREKLSEEFNNFNVNGKTENLIAPIVTSFNNERMTNFSMSQINFQYNMDKVSLQDLDKFKTRVLELFEILTSFGIEILHTTIFVNGETIVEDALSKVANNTLNKSLMSDDLIDAILKIGKKEEDLFYKNVTLANKKQIKLPKKVDKDGRIIPMPLISLNGILIENEVIDISYEINDKYSFDFTKNYHTTEFALNKMLYLLKENFESDIEKLLETGKF